MPSDYRLLLWLIDYHGASHAEAFMGNFPDQHLPECLKELEELGLIVRLTEDEAVDEPPVNVLAISQADLPLVTEALERRGAYVARDRVSQRPPVAKPRGETRVLVVEDDPDQLALADLRVSMAGYSVRTADSRAALLRAIADTGIPDLLLLDVMLPDGNGFQILRNFRKLASFANLPIILLTARTRPADVIEGLQLGADGYITKPYSKTILAEVVAQVLRRPTATEPPAG